MGGKWDVHTMRQAWDRASKVYLERRGHDVGSVSYGNLAPDERALGLLGSLQGKRVLDIGCGGGQNAVACALAGADVVGVDPSVAQLMAARKLAHEHRVQVEWRAGDGVNIGEELASFDVILAVQVLSYVGDPAEMLRKAATRLRPTGKLVVSIDHPIRDCFFDVEAQEFVPYPVWDYFDERTLQWDFEPEVSMQTHHHPMGQWIAWIRHAELTLQQLIEAAAPDAICDELWPLDSPLAPFRNIPHTLIMVASIAR
jgi:SAM-dependent methyltransferase